MEIRFIGGAGTVTGSKFLVSSTETKVLIDCGLFQGLKELRLLNWAEFPFDPKDIQAVILTHAHLDHCGALPLLVRGGFKGSIFCTPPTRDLTRLILLDSAKIQEEDADYANKKGFSKHHPALPLYTTEDVEQTLPLIKTIDFHHEFKVNSLYFEFYRAGHILGASSVMLHNKMKRFFFSGDLGRNNDPLMWPPEPPPESDLIIMESTYGDRDHSPIPSLSVLKDCLLRAINNKSTLLIPSFAVGRAQNLIFEIVHLMKIGEVPPLPVFLNTPMGSEVSEFYEKFPFYHRLGPGVFNEFMAKVQTIHSVEESKGLNIKKGPFVVIAASGMLTGGRVLHHLKAMASHEQNIILLPGFQSPGTRGWSLVNGSSEIKLHGSYIPIKASIVQSDSFSAHADRSELLNWLGSSLGPSKSVILIHGEPPASDELRRRIQDRFNIPVKIPKLGDIIAL